MKRQSLDPLGNLLKNMNDVDCLLAIHKDLTGIESGRRWGVAVLNKSAVVLVTACWEAFVEDLAHTAFEFLLSRATKHGDVPNKVKSLASGSLLGDPNQLRVWDLADDGWKQVLRSYESSELESFHSPTPVRVDELFRNLIGLKSLSACWHWKGMPTQRASVWLTQYIRDRGDIAHRASAGRAIDKTYVIGYRDFVYRLATHTHDHVRLYLQKATGVEPWPSAIIA